MIVFRFRPVRRSVERIEQPSRRHRTARSAESGVERNVSRVKACVGFAEGSFTGNAAPPLDTAFTKVPKSLAGSVFTTFAGHISLVFLAGQADNEFASALRLTPRAEQPRF